MKKPASIIIAAVIGIAVLAVLTGFLWPRKSAAQKVLIGHSGGVMLGSVYAAAQDEDWNKSFDLVRLKSAADVGYALLSGDIAAGFLEISKIPALEKLAGFEGLTAVGEVSFPYGATVILRKGLDLRLSELGGRRIAVSSESCVLLEALAADAERLVIDFSSFQLVVVPFEDMLPALEAGAVDAAVTRSAHSALAQHLGHTVLYQNWEVVAGDECCPPIIDQVQQVLLVRKDSPQAALLLPQRLLEIQEQKRAEQVREIIAGSTNISITVLSKLPVARFSLADQSLVELLLDHAHPEGDAHDDDKTKETGAEIA